MMIMGSAIMTHIRIQVSSEIDEFCGHSSLITPTLHGPAVVLLSVIISFTHHRVQTNVLHAFVLKLLFFFLLYAGTM